MGRDEETVMWQTTFPGCRGFSREEGVSPPEYLTDSSKLQLFCSKQSASLIKPIFCFANDLPALEDRTVTVDTNNLCIDLVNTVS